MKEAITLRAAFWILAGFAGLVLFFSDAAFARGLSFYDLVAILSAITSGIAVVFIRGLSKDYHPSTIYASQCVYGVVLTVPVAGSAVFRGDVADNVAAFREATAGRPEIAPKGLWRSAKRSRRRPGPTSS